LITGSLLFLVTFVLELVQFNGTADERTLDFCLATQRVLGSRLFS